MPQNYPLPTKTVQHVIVMSDAVDFTIGIGADGSAVTPVDLGGNFEGILVACADMGGVQAATTMAAKVGFDAAGTMYDLYAQDDPSSAWVSSGNLPTSGTMMAEFTLAKGVRRLQLILSQVTAGAAVTFSIRGWNRGF